MHVHDDGGTMLMPSTSDDNDKGRDSTWWGSRPLFVSDGDRGRRTL